MNSVISLGTDTLQAIFERHADRYSHQIICTAADGSQIVWASQEGTPDDTWPASPPLQSLHVETRSDGSQTIMLVGMAGRSHWSMSVEADEQHDRILFDVACRISDPPHWLGSIYRCLSQPAVPLSNHLLFTAGHGNQPENNLPLQLDPSTNTLRIPASVTLEKFPQTIRWSYSIGIPK
jgi:hypothetical protein